METERRFDYDPPPRNSPRLYGDVGGLSCQATVALRPAKLTAAGRVRLARDIAVYQSIEAGMSQRVAARAFGLSQVGILKIYRRMVCRKSRV